MLLQLTATRTPVAKSPMTAERIFVALFNLIISLLC
jgi:hypothetical protein